MRERASELETFSARVAHFWVELPRARHDGEGRDDRHETDDSDHTSAGPDRRGILR